MVTRKKKPLNHETLTEEELKKHLNTYHVKRESPIKRYWRPAMAWQYFTVCLFDFLVAPIMHMQVQSGSSSPIDQWDPITLQAGGLYHVAMGAMVGIYAWTRSLEKINLTNKGILPVSPDEDLEATDIPIEDKTK